MAIPHNSYRTTDEDIENFEGIYENIMETSDSKPPIQLHYQLCFVLLILELLMIYRRSFSFLFGFNFFSQIQYRPPREKESFVLFCPEDGINVFAALF